MSQTVVHESIVGVVVINHLDIGAYDSLDGVGAVVWNWPDGGTR